MNNKELKDLRLKLGLSQGEFGTLIGIGWRMMAYVEAGEKELSKASALLANQLRLHHLQTQPSQEESE